jgi:hypothetical protein
VGAIDAPSEAQRTRYMGNFEELADNYDKLILEISLSGSTTGNVRGSPKS